MGPMDREVAELTIQLPPLAHDREYWAKRHTFIRLLAEDKDQAAQMERRRSEGAA
jgi:hypothetical protein